MCVCVFISVELCAVGMELAERLIAASPELFSDGGAGAGAGAGAGTGGRTSSQRSAGTDSRSKRRRTESSGRMCSAGAGVAVGLGAGSGDTVLDLDVGGAGAGAGASAGGAAGLNTIDFGEPHSPQPDFGFDHGQGFGDTFGLGPGGAGVIGMGEMEYSVAPGVMPRASPAAPPLSFMYVGDSGGLTLYKDQARVEIVGTGTRSVCR
jgi:hypothetical protein